ncbi:L-serine ammonia-lyase, iron-sulfur-dependent subunit beta [Clostridium sp. BJN0001]|uniref:L-serine ammonia-lyase, iron-sulfur-dependent subunit beta n=1 Tax=Clostridium sp. BJN0001 TaxID=2930219 RepID=UPI001FD1C3CE|nr:L-serine ammonia-lyase, iron-sulfur-dependent subunit beta [Clostridium sp. BJN0001]
MKQIGVFDIIGPIMVGPSSSHTAGAARLGKVARSIAGNDIREVTFILHGSFAKTYKGHGTDKALVAGILGMEPSDENLRNSLEIAKKRNIKVLFKTADLGNIHPNTVKFIIRTSDDKYVEVLGSSIGGGNIKITEVNDNEVDFNGNYETLIIIHKDTPGIINHVSCALYDREINIAFMKVFRYEKGEGATMVLELDSKISDSLISKIREIDTVRKVILIHPVEEDEI